MMAKAMKNAAMNRSVLNLARLFVYNVPDANPPLRPMIFTVNGY